MNTSEGPLSGVQNMGPLGIARSSTNSSCATDPAETPSAYSAYITLNVQLKVRNYYGIFSITIWQKGVQK